MSQIKTWWTNLNRSSPEMPNKVDPRMYLVLREDLAYKYIQGGHALSQFGLEHPLEFKQWNNEYLICLSVFNGLALDEVKKELDESDFINIKWEDESPKYPYSSFNEPDLQSPLDTAIAIFENGDGYVSAALKKLKMATK